MATPKRRCLGHAGKRCPKLIPKGKSRCPSCESLRNAARWKRTNRGGRYKTPDWKRARIAAIERDRRVCQCCGKGPTPEDPLLVHHRDGNSRNNALANLETLLRSCHSRIEAAIRKQNRRG